MCQSGPTLVEFPSGWDITLSNQFNIMIGTPLDWNAANSQSRVSSEADKTPTHLSL
jgi:hypothetical protein